MEKTAKEIRQCANCERGIAQGQSVCGYCGGRPAKSTVLQDSVSTTEEIITFEHPQTGKDIQIVFPEMKPEPERGGESVDYWRGWRFAACAMEIDPNKVSAPVSAAMVECQHRLLVMAQDAMRTPEVALPVREQTRLLDAINWAMGCGGEFAVPEDAASRRYWWREELAKRAGLIYDGQKYAIAGEKE